MTLNLNALGKSQDEEKPAHSRLQSLVKDLVTWLNVVWLPGETRWNRLVGKYKLNGDQCQCGSSLTTY